MMCETKSGFKCENPKIFIKRPSMIPHTKHHSLAYKDFYCCNSVYLKHGDR